MAYTKTSWIDKAVQFPRRFFMNSDGGNDKNLLPPFSDWAKHANLTINSDYSGTLNATAGFQSTTIEIPAIPSTQYKIQATLTASAGSAVLNYYSVNASGTATYLGERNQGGAPVTLTTLADGVKIRINFTNTVAGTFSIDNFQLELGTTATAFAPKKMYTITQSGGTVTANGTPVNAANLNKIEQGVADAHSLIQDTQILTVMGAI